MNARARWDGVLFFLIALAGAAAYAFFDQNTLLWDEYYHLLAGRSWATNGTLAIGDGVYQRSAWLSVTVGWLFRMFGESIIVARMGAAVLTATWALVVFLWTYREAGRLAAWTAGLLFGLSPLVLVNSVMVRFYGVAGLLVTLMALSAHEVVDRTRDWRKGSALVLVAAVCGLAAYRTTTLTRVWVAGLIVWAAGALAIKSARSWNTARSAAAAAIGAVALLVVWRSGWVGDLWSVYREAPMWSSSRANDVGWYEGMIRADYPILWALFPAAIILALVRRPQVAALCSCIFVIGMVALSGAGSKAERYALPLLPFWFMLWGMAVAEVVPPLRSLIRSASDRLLGTAPRPLERLARPAMLAAVLGFVLLANPGVVRIRGIPAGRVSSLDRPDLGVAPETWDEVAPELRRLMSQVDAVVTANSMELLYHVGDYDFAMHPTIIPELEPPEDFSVDSRTGRPTISTLASLQAVMRQRATGLIVGELRRWGHPFEGFTPDVAEFVYANLEEVSLPEHFGVRAYRWGPSPDR